MKAMALDTTTGAAGGERRAPLRSLEQPGGAGVLGDRRRACIIKRRASAIALVLARVRREQPSVPRWWLDPPVWATRRSLPGALPSTRTSLTIASLTLRTL